MRNGLLRALFALLSLSACIGLKPGFDRHATADAGVKPMDAEEDAAKEDVGDDDDARDANGGGDAAEVGVDASPDRPVADLGAPDSGAIDTGVSIDAGPEVGSDVGAESGTDVEGDGPASDAPDAGTDATVGEQ